MISNNVTVYMPGCKLKHGLYGYGILSTAGQVSDSVTNLTINFHWFVCW